MLVSHLGWCGMWGLYEPLTEAEVDAVILLQEEARPIIKRLEVLDGGISPRLNLSRSEVASEMAAIERLTGEATMKLSLIEREARIISTMAHQRFVDRAALPVRKRIH
jgi:hypothetical protein